jgi:hypothetical protein
MSLLAFTLCNCMIFAAPVESHRVHITIVRQESSIRSSTGNRDAYLVRITPAKGKPFDARMIDRYPSYDEELPSSLIGENVLVSVELQRTPGCDQPVVESAALTNEEPVHCFALVHHSWKAPKGQAVEEWWK